MGGEGFVCYFYLSFGIGFLEVASGRFAISQNLYLFLTSFPATSPLTPSPSSQLEAPDPWLQHDNPWELPRSDVTYEIRFYGHSERLENGKALWSGGQEVLAMAYDLMIPGYETRNTNNVRLWESKPKRGFDLNSFNGEL